MARGSPESILKGTPEIIDEALGVTDIERSSRYSCEESCQRLVRPPGFDAKSLVAGLYKCIDGNWPGERPASKENWRLERCEKISDKNKSSEVQLERSIAQREACLANQVPVASGLLSEYADKRCAIDLVYRCSAQGHADCYALVELKTGSNTPLHAAFEILLYGLIYLFSRGSRARELGYDTSAVELLRAKRIHLWVCAPEGFYQYKNQEYSLAWLEKDLSDAIGQFAREKAGIDMDFSFWAFPDGATFFRQEDLRRVFCAVMVPGTKGTR